MGARLVHLRDVLVPETAEDLRLELEPTQRRAVSRLAPTTTNELWPWRVIRCWSAGVYASLFVISAITVPRPSGRGSLRLSGRYPLGRAPPTPILLRHTLLFRLAGNDRGEACTLSKIGVVLAASLAGVLG